MLRSGKQRLSDFDRLWLELDDMIARRRRNLFVMTAVIFGLLMSAGCAFALITGDGEAIIPSCFMSMFFGIFAMIFLWAANTAIQRTQRKIDFAKELTEAFADDYHPAKKINYYLDLRSYDSTDKRYWSGRSMHGNSKYKYKDRWCRQKFWLIDGTRVVVERKSDHKVRKGALIRHKRRVYVKIYPSAKSFGAGPYKGDADLEDMVRAAVRQSFHDPPEFLRVRREGPKDHLLVKITQLDAPILGKEVVALVEAVLLYLRMKA